APPEARSPRPPGEPTSVLPAKQTRDVRLFPGDGAVVEAELALAAQELGGMELGLAVHSDGGDHVMDQLVVDDVGDEVAGDPGAIEHRVNADQALLRAVGAQLDGRARRR